MSLAAAGYVPDSRKNASWGSLTLIAACAASAWLLPAGAEAYPGERVGLIADGPASGDTTETGFGLANRPTLVLDLPPVALTKPTKEGEQSRRHDGVEVPVMLAELTTDAPLGKRTQRSNAEASEEATRAARQAMVAHHESQNERNELLKRLVAGEPMPGAPVLYEGAGAEVELFFTSDDFATQVKPQLDEAGLPAYQIQNRDYRQPAAGPAVHDLFHLKWLEDQFLVSEGEVRAPPEFDVVRCPPGACGLSRRQQGLRWPR